MPAILILSISIFAVGICLNISAQQNSDQQDAEYKKVVTKRATGIVNTLQLTDSIKYNQTLQEITDQYIQVNAVHDQDKSTLAEIKQQSVTEDQRSAALKKQEEKKSAALLQLHAKFIDHLKKTLTNEQVDKVKDGMTYNVLHVTYDAYQDMLPNLTSEQKDKIYNWLIEARELAMDEGSSEKKHAVFGKYKGRINNYLSAAGYDLNKETAAWQQRIKERNAAKKQATQ